MREDTAIAADGPRSTDPSTPVISRRDGAVLNLHLANARRRNVIGKATIQAIDTALSALDADVRVILLTADGPDFCAGYDLSEAASDGPAGLLARPDAFAGLRNSLVPVVVALQGHVIGGGLELALSADIRIASIDLRLAIPASRLGLVYSAEGARLLVDELGESVARSMLVGGREIDAQAAGSLGIVSDIVPLARLWERAVLVAGEIAAWPEIATGGNRRLLDIVVGRTRGDADALRVASMAEGGYLARYLHDFAVSRTALGTGSAPKRERVRLRSFDGRRAASALRADAVVAGRQAAARAVGYVRSAPLNRRLRSMAENWLVAAQRFASVMIRRRLPSWHRGRPVVSMTAPVGRP